MVLLPLVRLVETIFRIFRIKSIAVRRLCQEKSVIVCGGRRRGDGRWGAVGERSCCSHRNLELMGGRLRPVRSLSSSWFLEFWHWVGGVENPEVEEGYVIVVHLGGYGLNNVLLIG